MFGGKLTRGSLALAGTALCCSLAAWAQSPTAGVAPSESICRIAFAVAKIRIEDGPALNDIQYDWAAGIESEQQLINCTQPPLGLMLSAHAMMGEGSAAEERQYSKEIAANLKQTQPADSYALWVTPLMNGAYGGKAPKTALYWLEYAASIGDPAALYELAGVYQLGAFHIAKDPAKAVELERQAADAGSPIAMFALGVRYLQGNDVKRNHKTGLGWVTKAAEHGYLDAAWFFATAYDGSAEGKSYGVREDRKKAQRFALLAAEAGHTKAMGLYASMLLRDPKSMRYEDEVFYWLNRAADEGDDQIAGILAQVGPDLRENYRKSRERKASIRKPIFKQCPEVNRCVVYKDQYGGTISRACAPQRDYWNCG